MITNRILVMLLIAVGSLNIVGCSIGASTPIVDYDPIPTLSPIPTSSDTFKITNQSTTNTPPEKPTLTLGKGKVINHFYISDPMVPTTSNQDAVDYEVFEIKTDATTTLSNLQESYQLIQEARPHINKADLFSVFKTNLNKDGVVTVQLWDVEFE
jgi:hypothetical protein